MKCPDCGAELDAMPVARIYLFCPKCEAFWIHVGTVTGPDPSSAIACQQKLARAVRIP